MTLGVTTEKQDKKNIILPNGVGKRVSFYGGSIERKKFLRLREFILESHLYILKNKRAIQSAFIGTTDHNAVLENALIKNTLEAIETNINWTQDKEKGIIFVEKNTIIYNKILYDKKARSFSNAKHNITEAILANQELIKKNLILTEDEKIFSFGLHTLQMKKTVVSRDTSCIREIQFNNNESIALFEIDDNKTEFFKESSGFYTRILRLPFGRKPLTTQKRQASLFQNPFLIPL